MDLITLILVVALIGFLLWIVTKYIPMPEPFPKVLIVVVVVVLILWVLRTFFTIPNVMR